MAENIGIRLSLSGAQAVQSGLSGVNKELGTLQTGALRVADALRGVGAALVAGLSIGAISAWTRATVNALDAFNDVADATGASIESLSRLEAVALRTGGSFDTVAGALVKLNQQLAAAKPDNEAGIALQMIGLEAEALRRIDPADALREVAVALAQFESDGNKARIVQELFGKSIREVAPLLNDLAEAGDISATVTAKQVAEAEKFNKQLAQLSANLTQTARSVTSDFLPAINGLLERINQIDDNKLQRFIDRLLTLGSPAFAVVLRQIQGAVSSVANSVAALPSTGAGAGRGFVAPETPRPSLGAVDDVLKRQRAASEAATAALKAQQAELELYAKRALKTMEAIDAAEEAANKALAEDARQLAANSLRRIDAVDEAEAAVDKALQTAQQMVEAITRETEQLQMSNVEREVSVALLELERAGLEKGTYAYDQYAAKIREAVVGRENVRESIERQRTIAAEYQRMSDQVGQSLTNALMEGGKNAADYIQGLFRSMVLRPVIQAVVGTALGMAPSGMGGGGGGAGSALSTLSALNTAYSAITRGFASVGATVSESLLRAGDYLATSGNNMLASSGEWLQGVSQGAGTIAASIAGAAAGYFARNAISRGFSMGRGMDTVQNIAVAVGSYINPVLGAVVGAVSGLLNRAFGRRLRDQGIRGTFGGEAGFVGENFEAFDGGWFRSDSTRTSELDAGTQRGLANAFHELQLNMAQMAAILNRPTMGDLVAFTRNIEISLQGLTDEQAAQALQTELNAVAEALAEAALGTGMFTREGETAVATLERLSRSLLSVNAIFDTLGLQAYIASLSGADMASQLADTAGGLENLSNLTTAYYETFYSEAERAATTTRQVGEALGNMGLQMPATREAFRALVEAQDLTTQSGRATFVALLQLSGAFAQVTAEIQETTGQMARDAVIEIAQSITGMRAAVNAADARLMNARRSVWQGYQQALGQVQALLQQGTAALGRFRASIAQVLDQLDLSADVSPFDERTRSRLLGERLDATATAARAGDANAQEQLAGLARDYLIAARNLSSTQVEYATQAASVRLMLEELQALTVAQQADIDRQARALDPALGSADTSLQSQLAAAVRELQGWQAAVSATAAQSAAAASALNDGMTEFNAASAAQRDAIGRLNQALAALGSLGLSAQAVQALSQGLAGGTSALSNALGVSDEVMAQLQIALGFSDEALSEAAERLRLVVAEQTLARLAESLGISAEALAVMATVLGVDPIVLERLTTALGIGSEQADELSTVLGLSAQERELLASALGVSSEQVDALSVALGVSPDALSALMSALGLSAASAETIGSLPTIIGFSAEARTEIAALATATGLAPGVVETLAQAIALKPGILNALADSLGIGASTREALSVVLGISNASRTALASALGTSAGHLQALSVALGVDSGVLSTLYTAIGLSRASTQTIASLPDVIGFSGEAKRQLTELATATGLQPDVVSTLAQSVALKPGVLAALAASLGVDDPTLADLGLSLGYSAATGGALATSLGLRDGLTAYLGSALGLSPSAMQAIQTLSSAAATTAASGGNPFISSNDIVGAYRATVGAGLMTEGEFVDRAMNEYGVSVTQLVNARNRLLGVPGYAAGGMHEGGWRLVGENGPELAYTGPQRIFSASQSRALMDTSALEREIAELRQQVVLLRAEARATAVATVKSAELLERATDGGQDYLRTVPA